MVIYCCTDLIFATKISSTAETLNVPARPARNAEAMRKRLERVDDGKLNDPVTGVMIDLEMGDDGLALLDQVKQHDPTIPVVTFGSHVATEALQAARQRGADFVLSRSMFSNSLPSLLEKMGSPAA
ncbi:MAG: response regulator [Phycisphaeraceae bacterium]|nr:response regulator [Phycisphaeraceae bacterium]